MSTGFSVMNPQLRRDLFEQYRVAILKEAEAAADKEILRAKLQFGIGNGDDEVVPLALITHDMIAREVDVTTRTVIRWIKSGELKALPKREDERKYKVPLEAWHKFKHRKGL
jgi:hypothetical protein